MHKHEPTAPRPLRRIARGSPQGQSHGGNLGFLRAHDAREAHAERRPRGSSAGPEGPAPVVMHLADGKTPYQAVRHLLEGAERRNRDTVLCREIVLSASPSYFRPGRESMGGVFEPDRVKAWATASLAWAKRQWPDQLASAVLHLDEMTPHMHLLVVPRVKSAAGVWKLNSKALFDRERLRELQTGYGEALAPLGIRRGEPGSQAVHSEVAQFYGAIKAAKLMAERPKVPLPPKAPVPPAAFADRLWGNVLRTMGQVMPHDAAMRAYRQELARWRDKVRKIKEDENRAWAGMAATAAIAPLSRRSTKLLESPLSDAHPTPEPRNRPRPR